MLSESVRIMFSKTGKLKYISHLDLCRTFRSAFKRAKIPIWYSQGFNPHPKMVFATTVSVGNESMCELLDIKITSPMEEDEFVARLQNALTGDIRIIKAYKPQRKFTDLRYAEYEIVLENDVGVTDVCQLLSKPIIIKKHTKNGEKEEDIVPLIKSVEVEGNKIIGVFSALQNQFLSPDNFIKGIGAVLGTELCALSVIRTKLFDECMVIFE